MMTSGSDGNDVGGNLLLLVLDIHPSQKRLREDSTLLTHLLNSLVVFCNSHMLLNPQNLLAVIATSSDRSTFLYSKDVESSREILRSNDGKCELLTHIDASIKDEIKNVILAAASHDEFHRESLLAAGLSMALCYIDRVKKEVAADGSQLSCRILSVVLSLEGASQYMHFMNMFFAAQKKNVVLDVCMLDKDAGLLQQGCDVTGGIYLKIPQIAGLLQYLLLVFLPDVKLRSKLNLPPPSPVDYRAACFCHRNLVEIGYVCSVCLSVFCTFSPICSTCESTFKLPESMTFLKKKKAKLS